MSHRPVIQTRALAIAMVFGSILGVPTRASAQTTTVLNVPRTQVTDTYLRSGVYAGKNYGALDTMSTAAGATADDTRHALLKFDTEKTLAAGTKITSAVLTLTVKSAGADALRTLGVFPVLTAFVDSEANWKQRRAGYLWTTLGGDFGAQAATTTVSNVVAAKLSIDVTALVQTAVNSKSSRYTRIGIADFGSASAGSVREFYTSEATDAAVRPSLTVVWGATTSTPPPASMTLRVMQYNTHHGGWGTDGVYDPARIVDWIVKANADIVSLNEIEQFTSWSKNLDQTVIYRDLLQQKTGVTWYKVFENHCGCSTGNGNLIVSKYPFTATAANLLPASRSAVDATVIVNGRTINFTSTHLDNVSSTNRLNEIADLLPWETNLVEQRIVAGDYNAGPITTEIANMTKTYTDTWAVAKAAATAIGNGITHGTSSRIDYIFQSKGATNLQLASVRIYNTADANGIMPSDHQPVLAVFEVK